MNFGDWEVRIEWLPWNPFFYGVSFYRPTQSGTEILLSDGSVETLKGGVAVGDFNKYYFAVMSDKQLQAFADALSKKGIKTQSDHKNEGLLEATKYHLEDMRTIALGRKK